jgi:hypothetical protein
MIRLENAIASFALSSILTDFLFLMPQRSRFANMALNEGNQE